MLPGRLVGARREAEQLSPLFWSATQALPAQRRAGLEATWHLYTYSNL